MTDPTDDLVARLTRAGVISHLVRLPGEPACLEQDAVSALLSRVGHSIFRIAPFLYGVQLAGAGEDPAEGLAGELSAMLNDTEVEVTRTCEAPVEGLGEAAILLLRALPEGVAAAGGGDLRAVIDAGYAARAAELTAERIDAAAAGAGDAGRSALESLLARLGALEERLAMAAPDLSGLEARLDGLERRLTTRAGTDGAETREGLEAVAARIERRLAALETRLLEDGAGLPDRLEAGLAALGERVAGLAPAETVTGGLDALATRIAGVEAGLPGDVSAALARIEDGLAAERDARAAGPAPAEIAERLAAVEAVLARQAEAGAGAETDPALARIEAGFADLADRVAALPPAGEGVDALAERLGAVEATLADLPGRVEAAVVGLADRFAAEDAAAIPLGELAARVEQAAEQGPALATDLARLTEEVAGLSARLETLTAARAATEDRAAERERAMRMGLAELAARIELGGLDRRPEFG